MNAVCVEDLLEVVETMKGAAADESISASKASPHRKQMTSWNESRTLQPKQLIALSLTSWKGSGCMQ